MQRAFNGADSQGRRVVRWGHEVTHHWDFGDGRLRTVEDVLALSGRIVDGLLGRKNGLGCAA